MNKKIMATSALVLVAIGIFVLYSERNGLGFFSKNCGDVDLQQITKKLNKDLPKEMSKMATWKKTEHENCKMSYIFKYKYSKEIITEQKIRDQKVPGLKKKACSEDLSKNLIIDNGISLNYVFNDKNDNHITTITVDREYCTSL